MHSDGPIDIIYLDGSESVRQISCSRIDRVFIYNDNIIAVFIMKSP